jgi:adenine-specific DNA-methyltransferase
VWSQRQGLRERLRDRGLTAAVDFQSPYLTTQLIAYIGNKRALLRFLHGVFQQAAGDGKRRRPARFLDPFAGSGAVSRLARMMGFAVAANDWEPYSHVINSCHLGLSPDDLRRLFLPRGGLERVLSELNSLPPPPDEARYIARHYAPRSTDSADWRTERLFYTTENALRIDAIRQRVEEMFPGQPADPDERRRKVVLLACLLYKAATHTNTSGVFKACHRGFGGHGRDALTRIMAPILLAPPVLVPSSAPAEVACMDAAEFLSGRTADICYLDPPYSVHQYGSNYFMLNTIALWDRPPVSRERGADGRLLKKAGIREDWTRTRSSFCYPSTARSALRQVVEAADCRHLVVSYSNEGLIGLEELCDLLSATGSLSVHSTAYLKYPGGKQSLDRRNSNTELALVVDRRGAPGAAGTKAVLRKAMIAQLLGRAFDPERVRQSFCTTPDGIRIQSSGGPLTLPMEHHWRFPAGTGAPSFPSAVDADNFIDLLSACEVKDVREEIEVIVGIMRAQPELAAGRQLVRKVLMLFNKLAHRKYAAEFAATLQVLRGLASELDGPPQLRAGLSRVVETARRRTGTVR